MTFSVDWGQPIFRFAFLFIGIYYFGRAVDVILMRIPISHYNDSYVNWMCTIFMIFQNQLVLLFL